MHLLCRYLLSNLPADLRPALMSAVLLCTMPASGSAAATGEPFYFVAIGDMPYELPLEPVKFDRLIAAVNAERPAFTIHVGDIFAGTSKCSEENYRMVKERFARFAQPLIYTPGDNEWTDCHRLLGGQYDPLERLATLRRLFFVPPDRSLGSAAIRLESQAASMRNRFPSYVENRRFEKNGVLFVTVHVVGSNNNLSRRRPQTRSEFDARNTANIAWIDDAFTRAIAMKKSAIVFAWQANVHRTPKANPEAPFSPAFIPTIDAIARGAARYRKPVLVISGDFHFYEVTPFRGVNHKPLANVTRLQVFGAGEVHGVRVNVSPGKPDPFAIAPLMVKGN